MSDVGKRIGSGSGSGCRTGSRSGCRIRNRSWNGSGGAEEVRTALQILDRLIAIRWRLTH